MTWLLHYVKLLLLAVIPAQFMFAADGADGVHTVDLSQSNNLKAFFDAGLRPWRLQGLESSECMLMNENLRIILPGNTSFSLKTEMVGISVLAGNQLATIDITCASKPIGDAAKDIRKILQDLEISTDGLDDFLSGKNFQQTKALAWGRGKTFNGVYVQIRVQSVPSLSSPMAMLTATILWHYPDATMKFLTSPIQPPPGYENVSMNEPPRDPNRKQLPEHDTQYYQNQVSQMVNRLPSGTSPTAPPNGQTSPSAASRTTPTQSTIPSSIPSKSSATVPQAPPSASWFNPWYGLLAVLLVIATIYALRRK
jgi:hypothetical protein